MGSRIRRWPATRTAGLVLALAAVTGLTPAATNAQSDAPVLPPGMQFPDAPVVPPVSRATTWIGFAELEGRPLLVGTTAGGRLDGLVAALAGPEGGWETVPIDPGTAPKAPSGRRRLGAGLSPGAPVVGPEGIALAGTATWNVPPEQIPSPVSAGLVWTSPDGRAWDRHDLREGLGAGVSIGSPALAPRPGGGWIAAATVGPLANDRPTRIAIVGWDGSGPWRSLAELDARWSLRATSLATFGDDGLLLVGRELICRTSDRGYVGEVGAQLRAWVSRDAGLTWDEVDLRGAEVLEEPERAPSSPRRCPEAYVTINERFATRGSLVGTLDGALVALSADGARAATTRDLRTWVAADLPGATPEGTLGRGTLAPVVVAAPGGGIAMLSLEGRRNDTGFVARPGYQVLGWRTMDGGATWERLPDPRPLRLAEPDGTTPVMQSDDQDLLAPAARATWLLERGDGRIERLRRGAEGPLEPWTPCIPVAGGDCAFALVDDLDLSRQDLAGVNLSAATIRGGDLTGTDLTGAVLAGAIVAAPMSDAILDRVDARGALFFGDMSGVSLERADLRGATVPFELLAELPQDRLAGMTFRVPVSAVPRPVMAGLDLRGSAFINAEPGSVGYLRDVDLRGADLRGARFSSVDLTGADLRRARLDGAFFFQATCPDGRPSKEGAFGPEACRLGAIRR